MEYCVHDIFMHTGQCEQTTCICALKIRSTGACGLPHAHMYLQSVYTNFIRETSRNCQVNLEEYTVAYTLLQAASP